MPGQGSTRSRWAGALAALVTLALPVLGEAQTRPAEQQITVQPEAIASFGACVDGSWAYVYGGHIGRAHQHSIDNLSTGFRRLNLLDRTSWEELPSGTPLQSVALVAHEGWMYRLGGLSARNRADEEDDLWSSDEVARFDPVAKKWYPLPKLPEPRSSHDACVLDGILYAAAGWNLGVGQDWLSTACSLDLSAPEKGWTALPPAPFQRRAVDLTAYNGRIFVIGGITPEGKLSGDVDIFDPKAGTWSGGPALPGHGFGASAAISGGRLIVSGMDGKVHALAADGSRWEPVGRLALPRFFHRMVPVSSNTVACIGGATNGGHIRWTEYFTMGAKPEPSLATLWVPYPGVGRNRQAAFLRNNTLYMFGGNNSLGQHDFEPDNFITEGYAVSIPKLSVDKVPDFPVRRQSQVVSFVPEGRAGVAYAIGGFGHDGEVARAHANNFQFDLKHKSWSPSSAKLPRPRTQFGVGHHEDTLWIIGGLDYHPERGPRSFEYPRNVLTLDLTNPQKFQETKFETPRPRRAFGGAQLGNRYYMVGGMRENFQVVPECDVFDLATGKWHEIPSPKQARISPQLVPFEGRLYLFGGSSPRGDGFEQNHSVEVFDPQHETWTVLVDELPFSVKHLRAFPLNHRIALTTTHIAGPTGARVALFDPGLPAMVEQRPTSRPSGPSSAF